MSVLRKTLQYIGLSAFLASSAVALDLTEEGRAQMTVVKPLAVMSTKDINFGTLSVTNAPENIMLQSWKHTRGVSYLEDPSNGEIKIFGSAGEAVTVEIQTNTQTDFAIEGVGLFLSFSDVVDDTSSERLSKAVVFPSNGVSTLPIRGGLKVATPSSLVEKSYTGTYTITVRYS